MKRVIGILLAFVMIVGSVSALEGVVKVKAAGSTVIKISPVTINGTVGVPIEPQTIEFTIENATFNTDLLYVGKDMTDYFIREKIYERNQSSSDRTSVFDNYIFKIDRRYFIPYGLNATIA